MRKIYIKLIAVLLLAAGLGASAQVPYEWPIVQSQLTTVIDTVNNIILSKGKQPGYCTAFAGDLLIANSNRGYQLFTPTPPGAPDTTYENRLLYQTDSMLLMMQALGYKAVDITISYPLLIDSFPNSSVYLAFYKKVYAMARGLGFKIIENCQVTLAADAGVTDPYMVAEIKKFYFDPGGITDTINAQRYLTTMTQMMQTVVDSLKPDYLTLEMEPQTQQVNMFNLLSFQPANTLTYVNYFLSHLTNTSGILLGAGAGTWNDISYFSNYATTSLDYIDYHLYATQGNTFNPMVFQIDSIARANGKKLLVGECWDNKISDSEYSVQSDPAYYTALTGERNVFSYFYGVDTIFVRDMVNLSQLDDMLMVNFFNTPVEFDYLNYNSSYDTLSIAQITSLGTGGEYRNMFKGIIGPLGLYTQQAIAKVNCIATGVNQFQVPGLKFQVYPNPAEDNFTVVLPSQISDAQVEVFNSIGQRIRSINSFSQNNLNISTSAFSAGVYYVRVLSKDINSTVKIVVE